MAVRWKDKRSVGMLTSVHELEFCATGKKSYLTNKDIIKQRCVHEYNQNMGGIDNVDRQLSITETVRKGDSQNSSTPKREARGLTKIN